MSDSKRITKEEFLKLKKEKNKLENELYEMKICKYFFLIFKFNRLIYTLLIIINVLKK